MKESELAFWQKMARHYTKYMDRSAPLYAAVCERIRPHLSRDMQVRNLASRPPPWTKVGAKSHPPGFSTRWISRSTRSGSGRMCRALAMTTASKDSGA